MKLQSVELRVADVAKTAEFFEKVWGLTPAGNGKLRGTSAFAFCMGSRSLNNAPDRAAKKAHCAERNDQCGKLHVHDDQKLPKLFPGLATCWKLVWPE